jgi:hypothetical protein
MDIGMFLFGRTRCETPIQGTALGAFPVGVGAIRSGTIRRGPTAIVDPLQNCMQAKIASRERLGSEEVCGFTPHRCRAALAE